MINVFEGILVFVPVFIAGYMFGYWRGEERGYFTAVRARWEREAREWDRRHERSMSKFVVDV